MADIAYNRGLDELSTWSSNTFRFLLLKGSGYTPNVDHDFVSDLTPASNEVAGAGYSRPTAASKTRTIDDTNDRITYGCANPSFGSIVAGETVTGAVLYRFVSADTNSILIAYYDLVDTATDGNAFTIALTGGLVAYVNQGA